MARHEVALTRREQVAEGTMAFHFEKPAGFSFKPGQSASFTLLDPPAEPNSVRRTFSLASAPFEPELMITTRMREGSHFKRALEALAPGARVRLSGPLGNMTLHEDPTRAAVFIAGGIGITPFRSMLLQAEHDRLGHDLFLAYSNRRREQAAFLEELERLARRYPRFRLLGATTETEGLLDAAMVEAMKAMLERNGVGADDVRSEEFYGY